MTDYKINHLFPTPVFIFESLKNIDNNQLVNYCVNPNKNTKEVFHSENIYEDENTINPFVKDLIFNVLDKVKKYIEIMKLDAFPFSISYYINNFWYNINPPESFTEVHYHPKNFLSAIYYVKVPKNSGDLIIYNPNQIYSFWWDQFLAPSKEQSRYTTFTSDTQDLIPKEGNLIILPAWLKHGVSKNMSDENRISFSFNIMVKPNQN